MNKFSILYLLFTFILLTGCYTEADKSYEGRSWAYRELYKHLRKGGVFLSDDIGDNSAYQDFCEENEIESLIVEFEGKYVGVFVK